MLRSYHVQVHDAIFMMEVVLENDIANVESGRCFWCVVPNLGGKTREHHFLPMRYGHLTRTHTYDPCSHQSGPKSADESKYGVPSFGQGVVLNTIKC